MTTVTIYAGTDDGYVSGNSTVYADARTTGTNTSTIVASAAVGQRNNAGTYICWEGFHHFDSTGVIASGDTVTAAVLSLASRGDNSVTDFTVEARAFTWSAPLLTSTFVSGDNLGSYTLLATINTASWAAIGSYSNLTSEPAFPGAVVKNGVTGILVNSDRHRTGQVPSSEWVNYDHTDQFGTTTDPKLTVTFTQGGTPVSGSDSGTAGEYASVFISGPGSGSLETATVSAALASTEAGAAADGTSARDAAVTDAATAADTATGSADLTATDAGAGAESSSVAVGGTVISSADAGAVTDTASTSAVLTGTDTAAAGDSSAPAAAATSSESATATETGAAAAVLSAADSASAGESATVSGNAVQITASDTAVASESATIAALYEAADAAAGSELAVLAAGYVLSDLASATESAVADAAASAGDAGSAADTARVLVALGLAARMRLSASAGPSSITSTGDDVPVITTARAKP